MAETRCLVRRSSVPLVALVLVAAGCSATDSAADGGTPSSSSSVKLTKAEDLSLPVAANTELSASWQAENFASLYSQEIKWRPCEPKDGLLPEIEAALTEKGVDVSQVKCGSVVAAQDWADPANLQTVEIAVVSIPSTGKKPLGTLMGNPGGPGVAGRDFMLGMAVSPGFDKILENYNLLGFDPRGIGASSPIHCSSSTYENAALRLGECVQNNKLAHYMGTSQVARDMELIRHLVGDPKMHYLGYSYGTMLGATYATLFPEKVGRMTLDSAEDAGWASPIHRFDQKIAIARAIGKLGEICQTEYLSKGAVASCPFSNEDGAAELVARLNAQPLIGNGNDKLTGADLQSFLVSMLYQSPANREIYMGALSRALSGDAEMVSVIVEANASGGSNIDAAGEIVTCHSFPANPDIPALLEHAKRVGVPKLLGGPEQQEEFLLSAADLGCFALVESGLDITTKFQAPDAKPLLVIGITGDHTTPFQYAEELAKQLESARLLTVEGQGHAASFQGRSSCADAAVTDYLVEGKLPEEGAVCKDDPVVGPTADAPTDTSTAVGEDAEGVPSSSETQTN